MTEDEEFEALEQRLNMKEQEYEQINHPNGVTTWKTKPKEQPKALRLADYLADRNRLDITCDEAAAELRRLHALNQELLEALKAVQKCHRLPKETDFITELEAVSEAVALVNSVLAKAQGASNE